MKFACKLLKIYLLLASIFPATMPDTLTPENVDQWEYTDVNLACTCGDCSMQQDFLKYVQWYVDSKEVIVSIINQQCAPLDFIPPVYTYKCSDTVHYLTIKNISRTRSGQKWACKHGISSVVSNNVTIKLKVPVSSVTIIPYQNTLTIVEYTTKDFQCKTSECRPQPTFKWMFISSNNKSSSILRTSSPSSSASDVMTFSDNYLLVANKSMNAGKLYCGAQNRNGEAIIWSGAIIFNVLYPPDNPTTIRGIQNGSVYSVIIGEFVNLTCSVTGGNPLSELSWNSVYVSSTDINDDVVTKDVRWLASGHDQTELKCSSVHPVKNYTAHVFINKLYPPDTPILKLNMAENAQDHIKVIENSTLTITCTANSNPAPNMFNWSRFTEENTSILIIPNIQRQTTGPLACQVFNKMNPTVGSSEIGTNISKVYIDVLYPPQVRIILNKTYIEGENQSQDCTTEDGNPNTTEFKWINVTDNKVVQTGKVLQLSSISRSATGQYTCIAENVMKSTDGTVRNGISTGQFFLDVQYAAFVSKMMADSHTDTYVTVNESDTVKLACTIIGNPIPSGSIILSTPLYGSEGNKELVVSHPAEKTFEAEFVASCYDAGKYTCTGNNTLYTGEQRTSNKSVTININCAPRMSRVHAVEHKVYTSIHVTVTLTFTAVAYPVPPTSGYTWSKQIKNSNWTIITRNNSIYNVSTQGLQSNLTVTNVTEFDYGLYNLTVSNSIGTFTFTFSLIPSGKPSPPVKYGILEETVTDSSVTIWWEPGFNGGDPQHFIISYRTSPSDDWLNLSSIPEEMGSSMTRKIGNLKSGALYYFLIYAENKNGSVKIARDIVVQTKDVTKTSSIVGAAAGGGVGGVLAIGIIVTVIIFLRNRAQKKRSQNSHKFTDNSFKNFSEDRFKDTQNRKNFDDKIHLVSTKNQCADSPILPARQPIKRETALDMLEPIEFDDKKPDDGVYGNTDEMIRRIERLEIAELVAYVSDKTAEFFRLEYQKLPQRLIHPYNDSQLPENLPLNRYKGIYPYDHSRVKDLNDPTFFVNASYINGYKKKKEYIASLGPLERTSKHFVTFWQMAWSEKSDVVVMLTKLIEPTGEKCEKYWPEFGTSLTYGEITVTGTGEDEFSDYILRTFTLSKGKDTRKFLQFHFMAWPDKSIPENTACLLEFRRMVRSKHKTGPMIVHCSAGIGRTGTFIAIDILIEEGKHKGAVNVLQCVKKMRDQRTMMVQTVEQYHYIFKAVVNALVFDNDAIAVKAFPKAMSKIKGNRIQEMYECLNKSVETDSTSESTARTVNKTQRDKNRVDSDIPGDEHRVRLFLDRDADMSDYINAVYINSFSTSNHFIVAQSPLPNKVEDFLAMVVQVECSCIVSLDEMAQAQAMGMYHPSDSTTLKIGKFRISSKVLDSRETYTVSKMSITYKGQREERQKHVYHFQYTHWPHGQKVPSNQENFIKFTKDVETFAKQCCTQESHVLVHCLNAFERSCLFCAVVTLTQKVDVEGEVCVPNILRLIRSRRKKAFPNKEQFEFCFNVVNTYIEMEKSTDTADDKTYMNTVLA